MGRANICRGLSYIITKGFPIPIDNKLVNYLGNGYVGPVPVMSIVMIVLVGGASYLLTKHRFGNRVLSIGGNEAAAHLSGINVKQYKILIIQLTNSIIFYNIYLCIYIKRQTYPNSKNLSRNSDMFAF